MTCQPCHFIHITLHHYITNYNKLKLACRAGLLLHILHKANIVAGVRKKTKETIKEGTRKRKQETDGTKDRMGKYRAILLSSESLKRRQNVSWKLTSCLISLLSLGLLTNMIFDFVFSGFFSCLDIQRLLCQYWLTADPEGSESSLMVP